MTSTTRTIWFSRFMHTQEGEPLVIETTSEEARTYGLTKLHVMRKHFGFLIATKEASSTPLEALKLLLLRTSTAREKARMELEDCEQKCKAIEEAIAKGG